MSSRELLLRTGRASLLVAGALLGFGCMSADEVASRWVLLSRGTQPAIDPRARFDGPGGLFALDLNRPESPPRLLTAGLESAGAPAVSWSGQRALFVGRSAEADPLGLWILDLPDGTPRRVGPEDMECGSADFLPDGRIVFSARTGGSPPTPELASSWALFVLDPETDDKQRITFGLTELDPTVLSDGRILYSQWQPPGSRRAKGAFALFAVHPDGTGVAGVHGYHDGPVWKLRPWQTSAGDLMFSAGDAAFRWLRVDRRSPSAAAIELELLSRLGSVVIGRGFADSVIAVGSEGLYELPLLDGPRAELVAPGVVATEVVAVGVRQRPQGHMSMVDTELDSGQIFGVDARPAGRLDAAKLRVRALAGPSGREEILGIVDLAEDGSFFIEVPADLPLLLDVLDMEGRPIELSTTPLWVRPREKRGCVGCHEDTDLAPPNRRPLAVIEPPVDLTAGAI